MISFREKIKDLSEHVTKLGLEYDTCYDFGYVSVMVEHLRKGRFLVAFHHDNVHVTVSPETVLCTVSSSDHSPESYPWMDWFEDVYRAVHSEDAVESHFLEGSISGSLVPSF